MKNEVMHAGNHSLISSPPRQRCQIAALCLIIFFVASFAWGEPVQPLPDQNSEPSVYEFTSEVVQEELTQAHLQEIIASLDAKVAVTKQQHLWQDGKWRNVLRTQLIDLSMWWKFADLTSWVLQAVGDHAGVRHTLFFAMPFLEWMCEPFVLPVDTALPEKQLAQEIVADIEGGPWPLDGQTFETWIRRNLRTELGRIAGLISARTAGAG